MTTFVPGVQRLAVERGSPSPSPPSSCSSSEIGKSWSFSIVWGAGDCSISPLFRFAQAGPPGHLLADEAVLGREACSTRTDPCRTRGRTRP